MKVQKNKIKKHLKRLIKFNDTIPNEAIPMLLKESYKNFLGHIKDLKNLLGLNSFEYDNGLVIFTGIDGFEYLYEIYANGDLVSVTEKIHKENIDRLQTQEDALNS